MMYNISSIYESEVRALFGKNTFNLKTVFKNEQTFLILKLKKKEMVNESLIRSIEHSDFSALINASWTKAGGSNRLTFDISNLVSLAEYIKTGISQDKFFEMTDQIRQILERCSKASMPLNNLVCNLKYSYYDIKSGKIHMIYAPVSNGSYKSNVTKYLYLFTSKAHIIESDSNVMSRYRSFLDERMFLQKKRKDKNAVFSYNDLYNFLHEIKANKKHEEPVQKEENDHHETCEPFRFESKKGGTVKAGAEERAGKANSGTVKAGAPRREEIKKEVYLEDAGYIKHIITGFPFVLGRDDSSDLVINDKYVGSKHAQILYENGKFYLADNNSTNGTYVDGAQITKVELKNESKFFIYDIPFIFYIKEQSETEREEKPIPPQTKTVAVTERKQSGKCLSYIEDVQNKINFHIMSYPCQHSELPGIEIAKENNRIVLKNISCETLMIESEQFAVGDDFQLFSGCSFSLDGKKYKFYIKD